jgi:hypothetical protein
VHHIIINLHPYVHVLSDVARVVSIDNLVRSFGWWLMLGAGLF